MRYKAAPLSVRSSSNPGPTRPPRVSSSFRALLVALLIPVIVIPLAIANAGSGLALSPSTATAGATIRVTATGLTPAARGQLLFDASATSMPTFRVDHRGTFSVTFVVPAKAAVGTHTISASVTGNNKKTAAVVLATAVLAVVSATAPSPTPTPRPTPTATPTAAPTKTPAPTATPAPTVASDPQPSFPIRAAFYYPWFPEAWNQQGMNPFTRYHPSLGFYDSSAGSTLAAHLAAFKYAGIDAGISSWWGQGSATDQRLPTILSATAGSPIRWAVYYEAEGTSDPSVAQITSDLTYLKSHYGSNPSYLRVNGKFVVFVYAGGNDACSMVDRWTQANANIGAYIVLKVFSGYRTCANQPSSWHQYSPAVATSSQAGYSYSISPGFWKANESSARLARDPSRFATDVAAMVASKAPWQLVTTFSEWGEGTSVESAKEWATSSGFGAYLDALHNNGGGPAPSPTTVPLATSTPVPVATATPTPVATSTPASGSATIDHTVVVWLENEEATGVTASSMPYLYGLASQYGRADAYYGVAHPSLPNYLAFWSGSTQGVTDDGTYTFDRASLSSQMAAAGRSWRTYAQDYPSAAGCHTGSTYSGAVDGPGVAGTYARKHVPAMSFSSVSTTAQCANIQPLASFDPSVDVAFVVPNLCNDAHDCSLATADAFLRGFVPKVTGSADWAHTLLVITFDEGSTSTNGGGRLFTAVIRPGLSGVVSSTAHDHYSLLRTIQTLNGLPCLAGSCTANTLSEFLH